jgi:hypothetical protein
MPPRSKPAPRLDELKTLTGEAQTRLAIELVAREKDTRSVRAALEVLQARPTPAARPALLARYEQLAADGVKRDAGSYLRAAILQALRPVAKGEDLPLLERAACTYEFLPPTRSEEAGLLRSTALVVMNELDSGLAAYHAVRLLGDPHTSRLSGEPALTAARVLAAMEQTGPLYYYVLYQGYAKDTPAEPRSDVLAECLKSLAGRLPVGLETELVEQYGESEDEVVLVGLLDLALAYEATTYVRTFLRTTKRYAVYQYLVTQVVVGHVAQWLAVLAEAAEQETDARKLALLEAALVLGRPDPVIRGALEGVRRKRAKNR